MPYSNSPGSSSVSFAKPPDGGLLHQSAMGIVQQGLRPGVGSGSPTRAQEYSVEDAQRQRAASFASPLHMLDRWTSWGEKLTGLGEEECRRRLRTHWSLMALISAALAGFSLILLVNPPATWLFDGSVMRKVYGGLVGQSVLCYTASLVASLTLVIQMDLRSTFEQFAEFIRNYVYFFGYVTLFLMLGVLLSLLTTILVVYETYGSSAGIPAIAVAVTAGVYVTVRATHMNCEAWTGSEKNYRFLRDHQPADRKMGVGQWLTATLRPYASEQLCLDYAGAFADAGCRNIETLALLDPCYIEPILTMAHISSGGSDHGVPKLHLSVIRKELSKLQRMRWLCAP